MARDTWWRYVAINYPAVERYSDANLQLSSLHRGRMEMQSKHLCLGTMNSDQSVFFPLRTHDYESQQF